GADQRHRAYPVLRDGVLLAMLDRARLDALDAAHGGQATLESALRGVSPGACAQPNETCRLVATRLAVHGLERLPVLDDPVSRRLLGIVSRSDLVKPALRHFDEEHKRERFHAMRPMRPARRAARAR
ncbi:CBS domain-containing protein, partial [Burkholderia gladioli]